MVNHIRTLMVNLSAGSLSGVWDGYVDESFVPVQPDQIASKVLSILFDGVNGVQDKIERVRAFMPFFNDPEFRPYRELFDPRETPEDSIGVGVSSVFDFYMSIPRSGFSEVDRYVVSQEAALVFTHVGDDHIDEYLDMLKSVYTGSSETPRRFSAVLYGVALRLDLAYRRSVGKA